MANKKKSVEASIAEMRSALVEHILDGNDEETEEKAIKGYVGSMSEGVLRGHYANAIVRPAERLKVIVDCLRRCAKDESAAGDKFIESLPDDWGNKDLNQLADDLCSGDLVIEEACEDELPADRQDGVRRPDPGQPSRCLGQREERLRGRVPLCHRDDVRRGRGAFQGRGGRGFLQRIRRGRDRVVEQEQPELPRERFGALDPHHQVATMADRGFDSRGWRWDIVSLKEKA